MPAKKRRVEIDPTTNRWIFRSPCSSGFSLGVSRAVIGDGLAFWVQQPKGTFSTSLSYEDAVALARLILREMGKK